MKLIFRFCFVLILMALCSNLYSQDPPSSAESIAKSQFEDQRYQKLRAALEDLQTAYVAQQERITKLSKEIGDRLREQAADRGQMVTRKEFNLLMEAVQELDRKREADKKLILEEIAKIGSSLKSEAVARAPEPSAPKPAREYEGSYQHEVLTGENTFSIIKAYNNEYSLGITVDDVAAANPGVKPELIRPGMVLNIPIPRK